jgi:hypothetical protein
VTDQPPPAESRSPAAALDDEIVVAGLPLAAGVPVLLLPVRIETRFVSEPAVTVKGQSGGPSLLVRVYPDTISVSSFEPELTPDEVTAGKAYWDLVWRAGLPPAADDAQAPWRVLAGAYQPQRAAWIAQATTPVNIADQPAAPTPDGEQPSPPPAYPDPPGRASSYEKAPAASALPDAWTVFLDRGDQVTAYTGAPIPTSLPVGLTPHDGTLPDGLPVDAGMRWLVDFAEAVEVGMGLTIPLAPADLKAGFDRIVVLGVRGGKQDGPGSTPFTGLLGAHHYTDGLAFVPQGTPTNNTPDAPAGYSRKDPDYAISFAVERGAPLTGDPTADGPVAAGLLGLPAQVFDHVQYADGHGVANGRAMLTALWPATLGYAMDQMFAPVFSAQALDQARRYALANAIPRGALPALRAGTTPYWVVPVTSLAAYPAAPVQSPLGGPDPEAALAGFLKPLIAIWQSSAAGAPHVGASADPDQDLMQVLGMDASSMDVRARQVIGDEAMWNLLQFTGVPLDEWWPEHLARGRALLDSLGLTGWDPRVIHTSIGRASYPVPYPTVQDGPLSEQLPLTADADVGGTMVNYITWIRNASLDDLRDENYPGPAPTSVLYRVLRQSMLREYVTLAGSAQVASGVLQASALREAELVNIRQATVNVTPWDILARPATTGSPVTWGQYLHDLDPPPESPFARLAELRASLDTLATLHTAELDRLLTETLDACSHRIDVWVSAIANSILARQRAAQPAEGAPTLHLGGYGWVENVRPAASRAAVSGADATAVTLLDDSRRRLMPEQDWAALRPVQEPASDNGGFVHAPSMTQAAAGAVLRSGYLTHRATPDEPVLAIDLSSDRTRAALWLLDGVRQGQSLGALTGYAFEESLHEADLDVYIQPFRDKYPLIGDELTPASPASTSVTPSQVVDGVKLRAGWQAGNLAPGANWGAGLPAPAPPDNDTQNTVLGFVGALDDMMDALADLSLAESVYQIMRGNFGRSGGMLDAVSRGDHPPQPDLIDTPQAGLDVTHRLMLLFAGPPPAVPAWSGIGTRPRAAAEPWLDAWLAGRLPAPDTVRCTVSWQSGGTTQRRQVLLRDLDIGPLDLLALADAADRPQRSELESRIAYAAEPPAGAQAVTISYDTADLPPGTVGFPDVLVVAGALRDMLNAAAPLRPQDFALPEAAAAGGSTDAAELSARAAALVQLLTNDIQALNTAMGGLPAAPQPVRDALLSAVGYGITGSVPVAPAGPVADLTTQAKAVLSEMRQRLSTAGQTTLPSTDPDAARAVITAILGGGVLVLPHVTPPDAAVLQSGFAQSAAMRAVDPQALDRWLLQLSHLRPAGERLDFAMSTSQLLGAPRPAPLDLAQLPVTADDRWLGLPVDPGQPPAQGRVAIEALAVGDPASQAPFAGLLLDQWLERIPSPTATAGVSLHYEEPKARAPQAMLLAVCPDGRELWDLALLRAIVEESLGLAKARAVDLASIQEAGQILPALYFPFNLAGATPATHFVAVEDAHAITSLGADTSAG